MTQASGQRGRDAEHLAASMLAGRGLVILERNWRCRHGELDLIARDGATVVFVEVRLRSRGEFGDAAASIGPLKRSRLLAAASTYLARFPTPPACRFDVVLLDGTTPPRLQWLQGAIEA